METLLIVSAMSIKTFHEFLWQFASFDMCLTTASVFDKLYRLLRRGAVGEPACLDDGQAKPG